MTAGPLCTVELLLKFYGQIYVNIFRYILRKFVFFGFIQGTLKAKIFSLMLCIGLLVAFVLTRSHLRNPLRKMFLLENVIFRGLRLSLGHFGQQALESPMSQLQNGVSTFFLSPFIVPY